MNIQSFLAHYAKHPQVAEYSELLGKHTHIRLQGLLGAATPLFFAATAQVGKQAYVAILPNREEAAYFYNDVLQFWGDEQVLFLPSSYKRSILYQKVDSVSVALRTDVLEAVSRPDWFGVVVSYPEALMELLVSQKQFKRATVAVERGAATHKDALAEQLSKMGFTRVDFVFEPGQFALRGSLLDVFSYAGEFPYRIDFWGDEVESIRSFDPISQLSKAKFDKITVVPNVQRELVRTERQSFFEFWGAEKLHIWGKNLNESLKDLEALFEKLEPLQVFVDEDESAEHTVAAKDIVLSPKAFEQELLHMHCTEWGQRFLFDTVANLRFAVEPQPVFNKNFGLLAEYFVEKQVEDYTVFLMSDNESQFERLKEILQQTVAELRDEAMRDFKLHFEPVMPSLHEGFVDHKLRMVVLTDHQIFGRYHKFKLRSRTQMASREAMSLKEINELRPGDYIVHTDFGIGRFGGLEQLTINNRTQDVIRLVYKGGDIVYVNIHSLHLISKYKGSEGEAPILHKLGSTTWQKQKAKAKGKIKDIAKDLIALYAVRQSEKGYSFSADTYMHRELEASFLYQDTPDQEKATRAVKEDMESDLPMDRLICGDVGFGKTEIAIRAAFKAVYDKKQVAILVPTTILALQHYRTFSKRLADMPVRVEYISRLKSAKKQRETLTDLASGKIDILIGTHRIIGKDIKFKDLGLLVIDEEQKFGVGVKEKLKQLKVNVDTLTLTATPIPRTMQFSLMGARDLSVISTAPPNRFPVVTELHTFNEDIIREAVFYEVERGGQVFFINNRIQNILEIQQLIERIAPNLRTVVAHGQMDGSKLEGIMLDFIEGNYDVLIATSIIESGLDIPNANTIIINEAHHFGLSDLHQLRGRVGRSDKKAFCYLLAPPISSLTADARRRMQAIEDFSGLGSGFQIAMQDLDIRGAGNLLGAEQSGFIADIGFENYQRILSEAIQELKENEFREFFSQKEGGQNDSLIKRFVNDCNVETDQTLHLPEAYVENVAERVKLYRRLDNIEAEADLQAFTNELVDRFGRLPAEVAGLFDVVRMRWLAVDLGVERIVYRNEKLHLFFVSQPSSAYYQSAVFTSIMRYLQHNPRDARISEKTKNLSLIFSKITDLTIALAKLQDITAFVKTSLNEPLGRI